MELCDGRSVAGGHEEIIYDRGLCPLCIAKNEVLDLQDKVKELEDRIETEDIEGM